jgi:hypothetical protein
MTTDEIDFILSTSEMVKDRSKALNQVIKPYTDRYDRSQIP